MDTYLYISFTEKKKLVSKDNMIKVVGSTKGEPRRLGTYRNIVGQCLVGEFVF